MSWIRRLLRDSPQTVIEVHPVAGAPPVDTGSGMFQPDRVAVRFVDGRFREMTIGGPVDGGIGLRRQRTYRRLRDVLQWAQRYAQPADRLF